MDEAKSVFESPEGYEAFLLYNRLAYRKKVCDPLIRQKLRDAKRAKYWANKGYDTPPPSSIAPGRGRKRKIIPENLDDIELLAVDIDRHLEFL